MTSIIYKSYSLSAEQEIEVKKALKDGEDKYSIIEDIVCESVFNAGVFFEYEIDINIEK